MPLAKYLSVMLVSGVKFLIGPFTALGLKLHIVEAFFCTLIGMTVSVVLFTYLGNFLKVQVFYRLFPRRRIFTPRNRRAVRIWRKYGLWGIAFLTPIFFSPIIGTLIAVSFERQSARIVLYMFLSAVFWSVLIVAFAYGLAEGWEKVGKHG